VSIGHFYFAQIGHYHFAATYGWIRLDVGVKASVISTPESSANTSIAVDSVIKMEFWRPG
jgi:hypothetical protein